MAREPHIEAIGLHTDPNPHTAPRGALRQASNCVLRRKGILEPRPGFKEAVSGWTAPATHNARTIVPHTTDQVVFSKSGAFWVARWLSDGGTGVFFNGPAYGGHVGYAKSRGSLYYTQTTGSTSGGVPEKIATDGGGSSTAGLPRMRQGAIEVDTSVGNPWYTSSGQVWYRVVGRTEDANGYVIRSAPSGIMRLSTGGTGSVKLTIPLPAVMGVGTVIEVYRTLVSAASTTLPTPVFRLAMEAEVSTLDVANDYITIYDEAEEADLGAELYTNSGQEGALQENNQPPNAAEVAAYRGSLFYGNVTVRDAFVPLKLTPQGVSGSTDAGDHLWHGYHVGDYGSGTDVTGDVTSGSAVLTVASHPYMDGTGGTLDAEDIFKPGMLVTEDGQTPGSDGTYIPWGTYIVSVDNGAETITLSENALATTTGLIFNTADVVELDGEKFAYGEFAASPSTTPALADYSSAANGATNGQNLAYIINRSGTNDWICSVIGRGEGYETLLFEREGWFDDGNTLTVTQGFRFTPLGGATDKFLEGTYTSEAESFPGRIYWSKTDLPEAVPRANYVDIGDVTKRVLRLVPTRDGLWVFKEDGIWRLTGFGADSGWRIDPFSTDVLVSPRAADEMDDVVFAWLQTGVCAVTPGGVTPISEPFVGRDLDAITQSVVEDGPAAGAFVRCNPIEREVYVGIPTGGSSDYTTEVLVYCTKTQAWTQWDLGLTDMVLGTDGKLRTAEYHATDYGARVERRNEANGVGCADLEYAITFGDTGNAAAPWEDTSGSGWAPAIGDAIHYQWEGGSDVVFVTYVEGGNEFQTSSTLSQFATDGTAYVAYTSTVEWVAKSASAPDVLKRWRDGAFVWESLYPAYQVGIGFKSDARPTADSDETVVVGGQFTDPSAAFSSAYSVYENAPQHFYVPRNYCLSAILRPRLVVTQATVCWAVSGLALNHDPVSTRHRRGYGS